jgi:hypothetical protein
MSRRLAVLVLVSIPLTFIIMDALDYEFSKLWTLAALVVLFGVSLYLSESHVKALEQNSELERQLLLAKPIEPTSHYQVALSLCQQQSIRVAAEARFSVAIVARAVDTEPDVVKVMIRGTSATLRQSEEDALTTDFVMDPTPEISVETVSYTFHCLKHNPRKPLNAYHLAFRISCPKACQLSVTVNAVRWGDPMLSGKSQALLAVDS